MIGLRPLGLLFEVRELFRVGSSGASTPLFRFADAALDVPPRDVARVASFADGAVEGSLSGFAAARPLARVGLVVGACCSLLVASGAPSFVMAALPLLVALGLGAVATSSSDGGCCCCCPSLDARDVFDGGAFFFATGFKVASSVLVVADLLDLRGRVVSSLGLSSAIVETGLESSIWWSSSDANAVDVAVVVDSPSLPPCKILELRLRFGCASVTRATADFFAPAVDLPLLETSPNTARDCLVRRPAAVVVLVIFGMTFFSLRLLVQDCDGSAGGTGG